MEIVDGDGYPLSKDRGCDVGKIQVDECDCPDDCPDYKQGTPKSCSTCRFNKTCCIKRPCKGYREWEAAK